MKIEIATLESVPWPIRTPAGIVEKRFRATITQLQPKSLAIKLDIEIRTENEKNPNQIIVSRLEIVDSNPFDRGITPTTLRSFKLDLLIKESVFAAVEAFYPKSKTNKRTYKFPSPHEVSRIQLIAEIMNGLGLDPKSTEIAKILRDQGVAMSERTIDNYKTKVKKANLYGNNISERENIIHPGIEDDSICDELQSAAQEKRPPRSPRQIKEDNEALQFKTKLEQDKKVKLTKQIREVQISRRNAKPQGRKVNEKRNPKAR